MTVIAIIQARMGSTRLPGKVLLPLGDTCMLAQVVARAQKVQGVNQVMIATSTLPADDAIAHLATDLNIACYRGSETDVLARYYAAAQSQQAEIIIRITADCPLLDAMLVSAMLKKFHLGRQQTPAVDYLSNCLVRTYPRGLDAEIFTFSALQKAHTQAQREEEREHVTPYIYQHPEQFTLMHFTAEQDHSHLRWTVDTPEDMALMKAIYTKLPAHFTTQAVLDLCAREPALLELNKQIRQKEISHVTAQ